MGADSYQTKPLTVTAVRKTLMLSVEKQRLTGCLLGIDDWLEEARAAAASEPQPPARHLPTSAMSCAESAHSMRDPLDQAVNATNACTAMVSALAALLERDATQGARSAAVNTDDDGRVVAKACQACYSLKQTCKRSAEGLPCDHCRRKRIPCESRLELKRGPRQKLNDNAKSSRARSSGSTSA